MKVLKFGAGLFAEDSNIEKIREVVESTEGDGAGTLRDGF